MFGLWAGVKLEVGQRVSTCPIFCVFKSLLFAYVWARSADSHSNYKARSLQLCQLTISVLINCQLKETRQRFMSCVSPSTIRTFWQIRNLLSCLTFSRKKTQQRRVDISNCISLEIWSLEDSSSATPFLSNLGLSA